MNPASRQTKLAKFFDKMLVTF